MRTTVNGEFCQGHGLCSLHAPNVFKIGDDDGLAYVDDEIVPLDQEVAVKRAIASCPEVAIGLIP